MVRLANLRSCFLCLKNSPCVTAGTEMQHVGASDHFVLSQICLSPFLSGMWKLHCLMCGIPSHITNY